MYGLNIYKLKNYRLTLNAATMYRPMLNQPSMYGLAMYELQV